MKTRHLLLTSTVAGLLAVGGAYAQQGGGQQGATAGQAKGGLPGQRVAQEKAQSQGAAIYVSTAGTREIQQALNKAGYSVGNVDGQWNNETQSAARNFQQANGLEPTGTLTLRTIIALGLDNQVLHPQNVSSGAGQGKGGLPGQRLAQETAGGKGTPIYISPAGVREIQQALNKVGYSVGNVDGQWSDQTVKAARNFQQAQGLEPSGQLDVALIGALGLRQQIFQPKVASAGAGGGQQGGGPAGQAKGGLPGQRVAQEKAAGQGAQLYASPATVREITQALNKAGYAGGNVNGNWDDETTKAARNFQQAKGLEPTGTATTELLAALGMNNWMQGGTATGSIRPGDGQQGQQGRDMQQQGGGGLGGGSSSGGRTGGPAGGGMPLPK